MTDPEYSFRTVWLIEASRERIFDALWDAQRWPEWWPGLERAVEADPGDSGGVGRRGRYSFRSMFGYAVGFDAVSTVVERPRLLEAEVSAGFDGYGRWELAEHGSATEITFVWRVSPAEGWIRTVGRRFRPVLVFAHDRVMDAGAKGLARQLDARLISTDNDLSAPGADP